MTTLSAIRASLLLLTLPLLTATPSRAQDYDIEDLGALAGKATTSAFWNRSIDSAGTVVGFASDGDPFDFFAGNVPFFWTKTGGIQVLPSLPGAAHTSALTINESGQILGVAGTSRTDYQAVVWVNGAIRALPRLPGDNAADPNDVNNRGTIVGISQFYLPTDPPLTPTSARPVVWDGDNVRLLPGGAGGGAALSINDRGQIVGTLHRAGVGDKYQADAVLWDGDTVRVLGDLGGPWTHPFSINNRGVVGGYGATATGEVHAFVAQNGVLTDQGTLGGGYSALWDMNEKGDAVGESLDADFNLLAVLYRNGTIRDLNTAIPAGSGWLLLFGSGINERGQISGTGILDGNVRAFRLTPRRR